MMDTNHDTRFSYPTSLTIVVSEVLAQHGETSGQAVSFRHRGAVTTADR
jgi:hypothetical protein